MLLFTGGNFMQALYRISNYHLNAQSSRTFRSGQKYLLLFVNSGICSFPGNAKLHSCCSPDIILLKPGQTLVPATKKSCCSLMAVSIPESSLAALSDSTCDLVQKFRFAPYGTSVIRAEIASSMLMRTMLARLDSLSAETHELGTQLFEKSLFTSFLIIFLRACVQNDQIHQLHEKKILIIDDVFEYISQHLTEDLSLSTLEQEFFVSGEHISREFKKSTGMTLHSYITKSRIDLGKKYLLQGLPVRDVCHLCGFGSYNHFFRVFKTECGMTPMAYYRKERSPV